MANVVLSAAVHGFMQSADQAAMQTAIGVSGGEPSLGNPAVDGSILTSLIDGTREWMAPDTSPLDTALSLAGITPYEGSVDLSTATTLSFDHGILIGVA
jgi:hypothetical protein